MQKGNTLYVNKNHVYRIVVHKAVIQLSNTHDTMKIILQLLHLYNTIAVLEMQLLFLYFIKKMEKADNFI